MYITGYVTKSAKENTTQHKEKINIYACHKRVKLTWKKNK